MHYKFYSEKAHTHYIQIELTVDKLAQQETIVQLPLWRPGRYELGNFAKNIQQFEVFDLVGNKIPFHKTDKTSWLIKNGNADAIKICYNYFANQPDAGACFCNADWIYVNPVHCCLFITDKMHEPHAVEIAIAHGWEVATSLHRQTHNLFEAENFEELVDSPFIASPTLNHQSYQSHDVNFTIWIQGNYNPDWTKLKSHFKSFTDLQIDVMRDIPCKEFHFLILALPYKFYHGVEHLKSTVLAIGPADKINEPEFYNELMGVSSHELFHVWNVKTIRPKAMLPYNYLKENYSTSGYVYEGVTTYYGDLFLMRCNYFSIEDYFKELNKRLMKHLNNAGRFNYSVSQSSFDTWLDGYVPGVPGRKTSIYDEGSLIALMLDLIIIKSTNRQKSLDDVMRSLYTDFGKMKLGYMDGDFISACENAAGIPLKDFFDKYVVAPASFENKLNDLLADVGCMIEVTPSTNNYERHFGLRIKIERGKTIVTDVVPDSPADKAGITIGDELLYVNNELVEDNLVYLISKYDNTIEVGIRSFYKEKTVFVMGSDLTYCSMYEVKEIAEKTFAQDKLFEFWLGRRS